MVRPQNLVTRDMSPTTTIEVNVESPESPTTSIESPERPTTTIESPESPSTSIESPERPTITIESPESPTNLEQAFDLGYDLTPPPNLELERSYGHYDYSTSSCTNLK